MMGILGPYSPFLVGGSGLSFRGGVKIASGGRVPSGPFREGRPPLWGTVRNGYRERPTLKMTHPTIVQYFGILEEFWRRKQGFSSNWLRILSKSIWRGGKMGRGKWYLDTSDKNCCYMGCMRPRHKRFSSAVSSDT